MEESVLQRGDLSNPTDIVVKILSY